MKFLALLLLFPLFAHAGDPYNEPRDPSRPCETYEQGCERPSRGEEYEPERENYPDNPDDPTTPGDFF